MPLIVQIVIMNVKIVNKTTFQMTQDVTQLYKEIEDSYNQRRFELKLCLCNILNKIK